MICSKCEDDIDIEEFPKRGKSYRKQCKKCYHEIVKASNNKVRKLKREYVIEDKKKGAQSVKKNATIVLIIIM